MRSPQVTALLLGVLVTACSGAPPAPPAKIAAHALCDGAHLDACERRLVAAEGADLHAIAADYAAARADHDAADPWAAVFRELDRGPHPAAAIVGDPRAATAAATLGAAARFASAPALPRPALLDEDALLGALAGAAGYRHVIHVRAASAGVTQLFPRDPLAPFLGGLPPVVRDDAALAHLGDDVALAAAIDEAFEAAGAFRYVDAARAADRLETLLSPRDPLAETSLRARYARQLLGNAGILLDAEDPRDDRPAPPPIPEAPPPAPIDTPYGDQLRVHLATSARAEWARRGSTILAAIAADRRDDLAALESAPADCNAQRRAPPMDGLRDLVFAHRLSGALVRDEATSKRGAAGGFLPLPAWLARYEALVDLVEKAHVGWSYAPTILLQRGEAFGLDPAGSATYRRVTALGKAHLDATRALEQSAPTRYRALSQVAFAVSPGVIFDDRLREPLIQLTEATVKDKLAAASDPPAIFAGVLTGAFAGLSYPPAVQEAHFVALQGALTAKLRGDLHRTTGWSTAGLHALDAAYRLVADQRPKLDVSAAEITRALHDPALPYPALGALATAGAQYAALAAAHKLDPDLHPVARFPPERRAARETLRAALAGLGAPGEAPNNVLDDVTDLADGLVATLTAAIGERAVDPTAVTKPGKTKRGSRPAATAPGPAICASKAAVVLTPATRRALARLGDVRLRILGHPRFKQGDGLWVRRARLLVTVLSDAMDVALKDDRRLVFTLPADAAEKSAADALREWDDRPAADVAAGVYALVREVATADTKERFLTRSGRPVQRVLTGLAALFRGEPGGATGAGVALLDAFARLGLGPDASGKSLDAMLVSYASAFYASGRADQGDLALLGAMAVAALTQGPPSPEAIALAAQHRSRITWALRFLAELTATSRNAAPDPSAYADAMRAATDDACQLPAAEGVLAVAGAVHDFAAGHRSEARAALDRFLDAAESDGLRVPRMAYRYEEKTATKVFALTLEVSYGAGMLQGSNTFQLGLGIRSRGEPEGSLTAALAPDDGARSDEESARYYVHAAALAAVYHLLDGDEARATTAARRAVAALTAGARLGPRALRTEHPAALGVDARATLAVAAQLAAEAGMPFLAGDLWTVVRQGLPESADDAVIAGILAPVPFGLTGVAELDPVIARTRKSLRAVADPLACTRAKIDLGTQEEPACDAYPLALSLRIADVLKKLPRLRRGDTGARCAPLRALDAFLGGADKGAYDPDAFTRAVEDLRASGRLYDAATLLTRQRREGHCGPLILAASRALGRSSTLGPLVRADLLSVAVNCTAAAGGPEVAADLLALDAATRALADPARSLKVLLSVADLAARTDQWALLEKLVAQPDFVDRWSTVHPTAAAAALLFDHASAVVAGRAVDLDKTHAAYALLCELFPPGDRADVCADLAALRAPPAGAPADRRRAAQEAVQRRIAAFTNPARSAPKPSP